MTVLITADARATERELAIRHVSMLVGTYRRMLKNPTMKGDFAAGLACHVRELVDEIALIQAEGEPGATLARRWCFLVGLGRYRLTLEAGREVRRV